MIDHPALVVDDLDWQRCGITTPPDGLHDRSRCENIGGALSLNLLSSVLPGFRALRAPVVSGFLWIAVIVLYSLTHKVKISVNAHDVNAVLSAAHTWFLAAAIPVALTIAYLIGIVMSGITTPIIRWLIKIAPKYINKTKKLVPAYWHYEGARRNIFRRFYNLINAAAYRLNPITSEARGYAIDYILSTLTAAGATTHAALVYPFEGAVRSIPDYSVQLAQTAPTQYQEYDRLQAEADFRLSVVPPLVCIGCLLPWHRTVWIVVAAIASAVLFFQAVSQTRKAIELIALSMFQGYAVMVPVKLLAEYFRSLDPQPQSDGEWAAEVVIGLGRHGFPEEANIAANGLGELEDDEAENAARERILLWDPGYVYALKYLDAEEEQEEESVIENTSRPSSSSSLS